MAQLEGAVSGIRANSKSSSEADYAALRELESRVMVLEYKARAAEKSPVLPLTLPAIESEAVDSRESRELRVLKEIVNQEIRMREKREELASKQYEELFEKLMKLERASYERKEVAPPLSPLKHSSFEMDFVKEAVEAISSRISSEAIAREKKDRSAKQYVDSLVSSLREELLAENKSLIESQTDTTREVNESLQALCAAISETKESVGRDLETTQSLISENVKSIRKIT